MSIYEFLKNRTPNELAAEGYALPDSGELTLRAGESWVPGAYEGIVLRTNMRIKQHLILDYHIARAVKRYVIHPSDAAYAKVERYPVKYSAISIADPICSICVALKITKKSEQKASLRALAKKLALESSKREAVKFGIALLGISGEPEDLEIIKPLGMHDEFTLYVAGTASRILEKDPTAKNAYLKELAESVSGWGKIAVMYEFDYSDPDTRLWTVTHGCDNRIGLSYLANVCATKGDMKSVLSDMQDGKFSESGAYEEKAIFHGICDIFTGLLDPEENNDGLNEYRDAYESAKYYAKLCEDRPELAVSDMRSEKILDGIKYIL